MGFIINPFSGEWFEAIFSDTISGNSNGWEDKNVRMIIDTAAFSGPSTASSLILTLVGGASSEGATLSSVYVGHQAAAGNDYDFDGSQAEVLFSAGSGIAVAVGTSEPSDATTFSFDSSKKLIVSYGIASGAPDNFAGAVNANIEVYSKTGGASDAGTTAPAGTYTKEGTNQNVGLSLITGS